MKPESKHKLWAALGTFLFTALLLVWLFCATLDWNPRALADASTPETAAMDDEEIFLDPELLNLGEENATANDAPAPAPLGQPEKADVDNTEIITPGENPKPNTSTEKLVKANKPSPVKSEEPSVTDKEKKKITSTVAGSFSPHNGTPTGNNGSSGAGGTGAGVKGSVHGRNFLGCPLPDVYLQHKTTVTVSITVDAAGNVTSASAQGGADAKIRRACEQAARKAKWSAKKGGGDDRGTLTFVITPK